MASSAPNPPLQAVGNYDLVEKVAEGGMGTVYKGRNRETGQIVAVKVVAAHAAGNQVLMKRFEQEYNAARQLDHPNIVKALEFGNTGSTPFLVMEFVNGETIGQKVEREGPIPEREAIRLIGQVAQGLYRAHREKLIHRDVKPDNIMITPDGQAKLTDMGLVKEVEADLNLTRTGRGLGTPHFMAPEQFKNAKNVDARCDIYALGATLYMMVTGEVPFHSSGALDAYLKKLENKLKPPRQLVPSLSERVDWAIRRAMSADPEGRPATCREFIEDLTGRSTRRTAPATDTAKSQQDVWYLVYKDEEGESHTVKGATSAIRRSLKEGLLGDAGNIRASRSKAGPFEPLRSHPEFRDLVVSLGGAASSHEPRSSSVVVAQPRSKAGSSFVEQPTVKEKAIASQQLRVPRIAIGPAKPARPRWPAWVPWSIFALLVVASAILGFFLIRW
jgi:serine/threonine protein kinase